MVADDVVVSKRNETGGQKKEGKNEASAKLILGTLFFGKNVE